MTSHPIPDRSDSRYAGQYARSVFPNRLLEIFADSERIALSSKDPDTARSRFELAVEVYHQLMSMSLPPDVRSSVTITMASLSDRFPSQVCINEAVGLCERAQKLKSIRKQLENLYRARDVLAPAMKIHDTGYDAVKSLDARVVTWIAEREGKAGAVTPSITRNSGDEYFTTMERLQGAIANGEYEEAANLAVENLRQVPAFVRGTRREFGSFDIRSIPALEQGGTILALMGKGECLQEMRNIVSSMRDLDPWLSAVIRHQEDRDLFTAILQAIERNPGCMQTEVKNLIGAEDGHRVANLISWLEKAGTVCLPLL